MLLPLVPFGKTFGSSVPVASKPVIIKKELISWTWGPCNHHNEADHLCYEEFNYDCETDCNSTKLRSKVKFKVQINIIMTLLGLNP